MARTLPWLKSTTSASTTSKPTRANPSKRQRLLSPTSDSDNTNPTTTTTKPPTLPLARPSSPLKKPPPTHLTHPRSPSTSPPPAPPLEEPMRPGLHADDIYIMVEDEFLSTAHLYTTHLHHAEYQRLKTLARSTNASTIQNISRPVDSITSMRAETRRKKAAEAQSTRTKAALEEMKGKSMVRAGGEGSGSESSFDENDGVEGPWEGTQLQRFMVKSPRKGLTSLTGLQGVMSHTRAAKGFERPERGGSPTPRRPNLQRKGGPVAVEEDSSSVDDDDLDAPKRAPSRAPAAVSKTPAISKPRAKPPSPPRPPAKRSFLDLTPLPKPAPTNTTKPSENTRRDPDPPPAKHEPVAEETRSTLSTTELLARRRRMKAKREREEKERKMSGGGKIEVDEIPVFLV